MNINFRKLAKEISSMLCLKDGFDSDKEAKELVKHVFDIDETRLLTGAADIIDDDKLVFLYALVKRRNGGEPLQYILGEWDFLGNTFFVDENVLIPRTETEQLAFESSTIIGDRSLNVTDMCCGSGCIGLSVALRCPNSFVKLCDISKDALRVAEKNRVKLGVENARTVECDVFSKSGRDAARGCDVFLCNPPYVPRDEIEAIQPEVRKEPVLAIDGGFEGMEFYNELSKNILPVLKDGAIFFFECGEGQPEKIISLIDKKAFDLTVQKDIFGVERFIRGRKRQEV